MFFVVIILFVIGLYCMIKILKMIRLLSENIFISTKFCHILLGDPILGIEGFILSLPPVSGGEQDQLLPLQLRILLIEAVPVVADLLLIQISVQPGKAIRKDVLLWNPKHFFINIYKPSSANHGIVILPVAGIGGMRGSCPAKPGIPNRLESYSGMP